MTNKQAEAKKQYGQHQIEKEHINQQLQVVQDNVPEMENGKYQGCITDIINITYENKLNELTQDECNAHVYQDLTETSS